MNKSTSETVDQVVDETSTDIVGDQPQEMATSGSHVDSAATDSAAEDESKNKENDGEEEGDDAEKGDEPSESQGQKKSRNRIRLEKQRARADAAEQRAIAAERELQDLRANGRAQKDDPENEGLFKTESVRAGRPSQDNFETYEEYVEALTDWKLDQREAKKAEDKKLEQMKSDFESKRMDHGKKVETFKKSHPDFDDKMEEVADVYIPPIIADAILDGGPELQYELAKDPAELERICALSPIAQAREIGKIEARIASQQKNEKKTQTKAPQPIATVRSGTSGNSHKSIFDEGLSFSEYEKLRSAQLQSKR